jgi:hypothetical protein
MGGLLLSKKQKMGGLLFIKKKKGRATNILKVKISPIQAKFSLEAQKKTQKIRINLVQ